MLECFRDIVSILSHSISFPLFLDSYRVMAPLLESTQPFDRVIFFNDIYFCAEDAARLLSHSPAHLVSGIDIVYDDAETNRLKIYDGWV
jgi:hypothetical protein